MLVEYKFRENVMLSKTVQGLDEKGFVTVHIEDVEYFNADPVEIKSEHFKALQKNIESGKYTGIEIRYWLSILSSIEEVEPVVVNGRYYVDNGMTDKNETFLGFGGHVFKYQRIGSDEVITTNNLWNGSDIIGLVREFIPDNAIFIKK